MTTVGTAHEFTQFIDLFHKFERARILSFLSFISVLFSDVIFHSWISENMLETKLSFMFNKGSSDMDRHVTYGCDYAQYVDPIQFNRKLTVTNWSVN